LREIAFIKQNKDKWESFENYLFNNISINPDTLSDLFIQINNDIAYSNTHYPKSKLNIYLNALGAASYQKIYLKKSSISTIKEFWSKEVPLLLYEKRLYIYFTFILFFVFILIGVFSSIYDESFIRGILGDNYVDTTIENIKKGDPAAVYNNHSKIGNLNSFVSITINNVRVGILMYISGFLIGIGTFKLLFFNSIMVGAFQTMFFKEGQLLKSMSAIWIHGSMEIFAMNIEAAAGFILGTSWIFPGSFTRFQSFIKNGKESLKIFLSTIPFTIFAGLLEGFTTQYYNEMPMFVAFAIIFATLGLILYYYIFFPIRIHRKHKNTLKNMLEEYEIQ